MKKIYLCNHTGSFNRGSDAIIKSTADLFKLYQVDTILAEHRKNEDAKLGFDEYKGIVQYSEFSNAPVKRLLSLVTGKVLKQEYLSTWFRQYALWKALKNSVGLNVGGDTYCYTRADRLPSMMLNNYCFKNKIPLVFWGCSIEKDIIQSPEVYQDLLKYKFICPREGLTYKYLCEAGISKDRLIMMADPAFTLKPEKVKLPENFMEKQMVAINLSPLVLNVSGKSDTLFENYMGMIDWILSHTNMNIALIPHVYRENDKQYEDLLALQRIADKYRNCDRILTFSESYTSKQLKYIISQCRFAVTARTHVSIAAYSSCVPTLVMGYSVKAKGIAMDLFGTDKNYVIGVQDIVAPDEMKNAFMWIYDHEMDIINKLKVQVPICQEKVKNAAKKIACELCNED